MRRPPLVAACGTAIAASVLFLGGVAQAAPAEQSPVGGENAHTHHIHTGSGCVDIASVRFEPAHRGLHQGAEHGKLWHGTCAGEVFPGGPPLPPFVPHH